MYRLQIRGEISLEQQQKISVLCQSDHVRRAPNLIKLGPFIGNDLNRGRRGGGGDGCLEWGWGEGGYGMHKAGILPALTCALVYSFCLKG